MKINNLIIGDDHPAVVIAEIGLNHNGSIKIAKQMIDIAVDCGANIVKFQKRDFKTLYREDVLDDPNKESQALQYLLPILRDIELSDDDYKQLVKYCEERDIIFMCTPWDKASVDFLEEIGVPAYKIGSPDMTNFELLEYVAKKGKPIIISTGMSHAEEIDKTYNFLKSLGAEFALLHCNSTYPAPFKDINLKFMQTMKSKYRVPIGYSGHERGVVIPVVAVALGANIIEKHFTLDRTMQGPDHAASIEPGGLARMIRDIRNVEAAMGEAKKKYTVGEGLQRETLSKSIVAAVDINEGDVIKKEMLCAKSPGKGLNPQMIPEIVGRLAAKNIKADNNLMKGDWK